MPSLWFRMARGLILLLIYTTQCIIDRMTNVRLADFWSCLRGCYLMKQCQIRLGFAKYHSKLFNGYVVGFFCHWLEIDKSHGAQQLWARKLVNKTEGL